MPLEFLAHPHPHSTKGTWETQRTLWLHHHIAPHSPACWDSIPTLFLGTEQLSLQEQREHDTSASVQECWDAHSRWVSRILWGVTAAWTWPTQSSAFPKEEVFPAWRVLSLLMKKVCCKAANQGHKIHYSVTSSTFFLWARNPPWLSGCTYTDISAAQIKNCFLEI